MPLVVGCLVKMGKKLLGIGRKESTGILNIQKKNKKIIKSIRKNEERHVKWQEAGKKGVIFLM